MAGNAASGTKPNRRLSAVGVPGSGYELLEVWNDVTFGRDGAPRRPRPRAASEGIAVSENHRFSEDADGAAPLPQLDCALSPKNRKLWIIREHDLGDDDVFLKIL